MDCKRAREILGNQYTGPELDITDMSLQKALAHSGNCNSLLCQAMRDMFLFTKLMCMRTKLEETKIPQEPVERDRWFLERAPFVTDAERLQIEECLARNLQIHPEIANSQGEPFWCPVFRLRVAVMIANGIPALEFLRCLIEGTTPNLMAEAAYALSRPHSQPE